MKTNLARLLMVGVLTTAGAGAGASAAEGIESRPIQFAKGASSATVQGSLKGDRTIDYTLRAKAGQTMTVALKTSNSANYFNVLPPGSTGEAIFTGSSGGNKWTGPLPADGQYTVRVYLMRSAARRNETADYTLTVGITGGGATSGAAASDAKVKGTPYHATGQILCSMGSAPAGSAECDFGVVRGKPGNADVHVASPGGFKRVLTFAGAKVTSNGDAKVRASKTGDLWSIDVNDYEHYR
ncbi:MAG: hypothetical protein ACK6DI_02500, partial [Betaproteobacteria bacterium]